MYIALRDSANVNEFTSAEISALLQILPEKRLVGSTFSDTFVQANGGNYLQIKRSKLTTTRFGISVHTHNAFPHQGLMRPRASILSTEIHGRDNNRQTLRQTRLRLPVHHRNTPGSVADLRCRYPHWPTIFQPMNTFTARNEKIARIRLRLLLLDQLILMLNTMPILAHRSKATRHIQVISRNDRILRHVLKGVRRRIVVGDLGIFIVRRLPGVRRRERAVAIGAEVQGVTDLVHHDGEAAPVVVAVALLVEDDDEVVRVVCIVVLGG